MYSEKTVRIVRPFPNKSLDSTTDYLSRGWFPPHAETAEKISSRARSGAYDNNRELLIEDLKKDYSFLSYCMLNSGKFLLDTRRSPNPLTNLRNAPAEQIRKLLDVHPRRISPHRLTKGTPGQIRQIKHSVISVTASETMGHMATERGFGAEADDILAANIFRQLGWNLIAWNYPLVHKRIMTESRHGNTEIEESVKKAIGISPTELALKFAGDCGADSDLRLSIGYAGPDANAISDLSKGELVGRLCELGEVFARAGEPELYPEAQNKWEASRLQLQTIVGESDFSSLGQSILIRATPLIETLPDNQKSAPGVTLEKFPESIEGAGLYRKNRSIEKCPEHLRERFRTVYNEITPGKQSVKAIQILVSDLIPAAGFSSGCIYLNRDGSNRLVPIVQFGRNGKNAYPVLNTLIRDAVVDSLYQTTPVMQEALDASGLHVMQISGALSHRHDSGVFLLEIPKETVELQDHQTLAYFRAIRQCLHDCMST